MSVGWQHDARFLDDIHRKFACNLGKGACVRSVSHLRTKWVSAITSLLALAEVFGKQVTDQINGTLLKRQEYVCACVNEPKGFIYIGASQNHIIE